MLTGKRPFNDTGREATVVIKVARGEKPSRPTSGFSDALWNLLLKAWDPEYKSQPSKRPSILTVSHQMKEDADDWDKFIAPPQQLQVELEESGA